MEPLKKKGDLVQYWFDTGAMGMTIAYGIVEKAGKVTYTIRSESGIKNRVRQDYKEVKLITDPELLAEAKRCLLPREPREVTFTLKVRTTTRWSDDNIWDKVRRLLKEDPNLEFELRKGTG